MSAINNIAAGASCTGAGAKKGIKKSTHRYGCFNRADFVASYQIPINPECGESVTTIETTAEPECQYRISKLGKKDPGCKGCSRKKAPK